MTAIFRHNNRFVARIDDGSLLLKYKCYNSSFCNPYKAILYPGVYLLECWGAEGGEIFAGYAGQGGYSSGVLTLKRKIEAFFHVGGKGYYKEGEESKGGNNGGSDGIYAFNHASAKELFYSSGGGASDIRLLKDDLYNRVIVSGGGGGHGYYKNGNDEVYYAKGGSGGGFEGEDGHKNFNGDIGQGGKANGIGRSILSSSFGSGGERGGGGGWYGGAGSYFGNGNGGGSGFVFNSTQYIPSNYHLTEEFMLTNTSLITGNTSIISPTGGSELGHHGSGAIRISIIDHFAIYGYICFTNKHSCRNSIKFIFLATCFLS